MEDMILERLAAYCEGRLNDDEKKLLCDWLDESPENRLQFEKYLRIVKMHRMIEGNRAICEEKSWKALTLKMHQRRALKLRRTVYAVAAVLVLSLGIGFAYLNSSQPVSDMPEMVQILPGSTKATLVLANGSEVDLTRNDLKEVKERGASIQNDTVEGLQYYLTHKLVEEPVYHTIKVPVAGEYHFTLSDGTRVWLNSASEFRFPVTFSSTNREVYVKGEAFFEVARQPEHPFIVHVNEVDIKVLGTRFNVTAYKENKEVVTTLAQGAVQVHMGGEYLQLLPGEQAVASPQDEVMDKRKVNVGRYIQWTKGIFEYENMTLEEIAENLSRWYDVNFIFSNPEFRKRHFTGVIRKYENLNDALKLIEMTTNVSFMINGKDIAVKAAIN